MIFSVNEMFAHIKTTFLMTKPTFPKIPKDDAELLSTFTGKNKRDNVRFRSEHPYSIFYYISFESF